jgi:hypothetical protein
LAKNEQRSRTESNSSPTLRQVKESKTVCVCGFHLKEANYSKVSGRYFCPECGKNSAQNEFENLPKSGSLPE